MRGEFPAFAAGSDPSGEAIIRIAEKWVVRRDRGLAASEAAELKQWLTSDPRHAAAFARLEVEWGRLGAIRAVPEFSTMAEVIIARARRVRRRNRLVASGWLAAAAAIMIAYIGWRPTTVPPASTPATNYEVVASTARRVMLPDGSVAELNGESEIESEFTAAERRVRLVRGEAHFIVKSDSQRPFLVSAGAVTVRAVGTAFDVRLVATVVEVLVTEGKVRLEHSTAETGAAHVDESTAHALVAGQRAIIDANAGIKAPVSVTIPEPAEIDEALAWQTTRLVFRNTPLHEVVTAFNRYNEHKLVLGDARLRTHALSGIFRADNLEGFVRLIRAGADVAAERTSENETVLHPAP